MTLYINCRKNDSPTFTKKDYLLRAANRLGLDVRSWEGEPDVEFVLNVEPYTHFIKGTKWTGIWEIDLALDRPETKEGDWAVADDVFIAISQYSTRFNPHAHKTRFLPQACDIEIHRRHPEITQSFDFVFSGSNGEDIYSERDRVMKVLKQHFTFEDFQKGHHPDKYIKFLNQAKVQFIRSGNTRVCNGWTAQRFYECLPIGPVLTDWTPDLAKTGLVEGEDYLSYKDDVEMVSNMYKLVYEKDLREKIANNGRTKALLFHTYEHRLISILNFAKQYE